MQKILKILWLPVKPGEMMTRKQLRGRPGLDGPWEEPVRNCSLHLGLSSPTSPLTRFVPRRQSPCLRAGALDYVTGAKDDTSQSSNLSIY